MSRYWDDAEEMELRQRQAALIADKTDDGRDVVRTDNGDDSILAGIRRGDIPTPEADK